LQSIKKGTKVYTRLQPLTGREITVRKRRQVFTVYVDNQETEQFPTQQQAMEAADQIADSNVLRIVPD
jgi:membrane-bound lytic murein transglycosylase MltF